MKNYNFKFSIDKYSYKKSDDYDISFIPMMARRKLSSLNKIALASMYECFENENINLVFSSQYADYEKLIQLLNQYEEENEVSPISFSNSVHNASIGIFSLLNKIQNSYISIGAAENSFHTGLLDAILNSKERDTLYCYADLGISFSCLIKKPNKNECFELISSYNDKVNSIDEFEEFLSGKRETFLGNNYTLIKFQN